MKLTLLILAALVAMALCQPDMCATDSDCSNHNCPTDTTHECIHGKCSCTAHGKRDHQVCNNDLDCANYSCANHAGDTPYCQHHGDPIHGQDSCSCH